MDARGEAYSSRSSVPLSNLVQVFNRGGRKPCCRHLDVDYSRCVEGLLFMIRQGTALRPQVLWLLRCVYLLPLLVVGHAAFASDPSEFVGPSMQFGIVRSNAPGCEPTCPEWISAQGVIRRDTPALLKRVLKILDGRKLPIIVDSPGGNVDAAMALGRMIRKNKLDIAVGKTYCDGFYPGSSCFRASEGVILRHLGDPFDRGAMCNSACPLMFVGGNRRLVGDQAFFGVHQVTTTYFRITRKYRTTYRTVRGKRHKIITEISTQDTVPSYKTYKMSKSLEKKVGAYLKEMGVENGMLTTIKNTPASAIHQLELQNMLRMKVVTSLGSFDLLAGGGNCRADPVPANCRTVVHPSEHKPMVQKVEAAGSFSDTERRSKPCADEKDGSELVGLSPNLGGKCDGSAEPAAWPTWRMGLPEGPYTPSSAKP